MNEKLEDKPPVLGTWGNVYLFVMVFQFVSILLFYLMMSYYRV